METVEGPPPALRYRRRSNPLLWARELWAAREVVWSLTERDLRARYKQTRLGFLWAIIVPVVLMIVFTLFVRRAVSVDTGGVPYVLFTYVGVLPWTFFSTAVNQGSQSIITNSSLLNKVYRPREVFPLASILVATIDTVIASTILAVLFVITGYAPKETFVWAPLLMLLQAAFTVGVTLLMSSMIVYLRDVRHLLPLLLQLGLFATPVAYPISLSGVVEDIYALVNPLGPIIDGYRQTILYGNSPDWSALRLSSISAVVVLILGYAIFKRLEQGFADVA